MENGMADAKAQRAGAPGAGAGSLIMLPISLNFALKKARREVRGMMVRGIIRKMPSPIPLTNICERKTGNGLEK